MSTAGQTNQEQWHFHSIKTFPAFARDWDALADREHAPPFLSARFIQRVIDSFSAGDEWLAIKGPAEDPLVMCLLQRLSHTRWQTFQPAQLSVGAWLMRPGLSFEQASEGLFQALPGFALVVGITQQDPHMHPRPQPGKRIEPVDYKEIGWIPIEGEFEAFWQARSKKFRQNHRTQCSRLKKDGIRAIAEQTCDRQTVAELVREFGELEIAGWKGRAGTAVSSDNAQGQFYQAVFEDFCEAGQARLWRLKFDDKTVAVDLCIEHRDAQVLLKTAFDESVRGISPSALLKYEVYRGAHADPNIRRVEFFGPYMDWTSRWTKHKRMMYHVNLFRYALVPKLRKLIHKLRTRND